MERNLWYSRKQEKCRTEMNACGVEKKGARPFVSAICVLLVDGVAYAYTGDTASRSIAAFDDVRHVISYDKEKSETVCLVSAEGLSPKGMDYAREKGLPQTVEAILASTVNFSRDIKPPSGILKEAPPPAAAKPVAKPGIAGP